MYPEIVGGTSLEAKLIAETWDEMVAAEPESGVYAGHISLQAQQALLENYPLAETEVQLRILELQRKL